MGGIEGAKMRGSKAAGDIVPFYRSGDPAMHTEEALQARKALQEDRRVVDMISLFWNVGQNSPRPPPPPAAAAAMRTVSSRRGAASAGR